VFIIILVIGIWLLVYGISNLSVRIKYIPISKVITGTVIDMRKAYARRGRTAYFPVIEYYNPETNNVEKFEHEVGNGYSKYNIGDILELRYYNGKSKKFVLVNTWAGIWSAPIAFIIAGLIFTALGLFIGLK
jgi:hypothetical protein